MTAKQLDSLISILDRFAKVAERWADVEYPEPHEAEEATISRVGEKQIPQSREEYDALPIEPVGRFESKLSS